MGLKNKKALTGSIITMFVATIMIIIILIVFVFLSYPLKTKIQSGTNSERMGFPIANGIKDISILRYSLNCQGEFNKEEKNLQQVLALWTEGNTETIKDFIVDNKCGGNAIIFFNNETPKYIFCLFEGFCKTGEISKESKEEVFKFGGTKEGINIDLSPSPIKISVSSALNFPHTQITLNWKQAHNMMNSNL